MNELYKMLERQVDSVENLASGSNGRMKPVICNNYAHPLHKYKHNLQSRGDLLIASYNRIEEKVHCFCNSDQMRTVFNSQAKASRSHKHNLLSCVLNDIAMINELCMTEELTYDGIASVFIEISDICDIQGEIASRKVTLQNELAAQIEKIVQSPFYKYGHMDCCYMQPGTQQSIESATEYVAMSKAKREHLVQFATNFHCYGQLLIRIFSKFQKQALSASTDEETRVSINSQITGFISKEHSLLACFQAEVLQCNTLCISEELETNTIAAIFSEIETVCNIRNEIECRQTELVQQLNMLQEKISESPFYVMEMQKKDASGVKKGITQTAKPIEEETSKKK